MNEFNLKTSLVIWNLEYEDVIFYTEVRFLSRDRKLKRMYDLTADDCLCLRIKWKSPQLFDCNCIHDFATYIASLAQHMNVLNISLQGASHIAKEMSDKLTPFERKLR